MISCESCQVFPFDSFINGGDKRGQSSFGHLLASPHRLRRRWEVEGGSQHL